MVNEIDELGRIAGSIDDAAEGAQPMAGF